VLGSQADRVDLLGIDRWIGGTHITTAWQAARAPDWFEHPEGRAGQKAVCCCAFAERVPPAGIEPAHTV
jgi:hypothetical protein